MGIFYESGSAKFCSNQNESLPNDGVFTLKESPLLKLQVNQFAKAMDFQDDSSRA